jgi:dCTP diphosphatase
MPDSQTSLAQLRQIVQQFVDERRWSVFHTPKNLASSIAIEAAELMEHFQWLTPEQSDSATDSSAKRQEIADEMADVLCYLLGLANRLDIDLSDAIVEKMAKNELKYPADKFRDRFGHDDPNYQG